MSKRWLGSSKTSNLDILKILEGRYCGKNWENCQLILTWGTQLNSFLYGPKSKLLNTTDYFREKCHFPIRGKDLPVRIKKKRTTICRSFSYFIYSIYLFEVRMISHL